MDVETEARRAALDFFVSLLRDVATFFPETGGAAAAAAAEVDADVEAQSAGFVAAQPAQSRAFLADFCRTQMFLCFVQPQRGDRNLRGGRCFLTTQSFTATGRFFDGGSHCSGVGGRSPVAEDERARGDPPPPNSFEPTALDFSWAVSRMCAARRAASSGQQHSTRSPHERSTGTRMGLRGGESLRAAVARSTLLVSSSK